MYSLGLAVLSGTDLCAMGKQCDDPERKIDTAGRPSSLENIRD